MPIEDLTRLIRKATHTPGLISFAGGLPAPETFPREQLARAAHDVIASGEPSPLQYDWPEGRVGLRARLAKRLQARGVKVTQDELVITNGAQDALALTLEVLQPRDVRVDRQTFPGALQAMRNAGVKVRSHGLTGARYLMPAIDNPRGQVMGDDERHRALHATWLIEDDAYAELRFDGTCPPPLYTRASDRTFLMGTFSKTLSPGLRVGWLLPPPQLLEKVKQTREGRDLMVNGLGEAMLERVLDTYDYDQHLENLRALYAGRCEQLSEALARLPGSSFRAPQGGFAIWLETGLLGDDATLLSCALRCGVSFDPGCLFRPGDSRRGGEQGPALSLRLSFSSVPREQIAEGVRRLARALAMAQLHLSHRAHAA
jgi:2-aminoadipate transaminase